AKKPQEEDESKKAWLGIDVKADGGRLFVSTVKRGSPAFVAGINVGDELLAIGDLRIPADQWAKRIAMYRPDETVSILISRRERLFRLYAKLGVEPRSRWKLGIDPSATNIQIQHRKSWLCEE